MHAHSIAALKKAALLLPLLLLCGCGGGGGGRPQTPTDAIEILRQDGLLFILEPNVPATPMGDEMPFWFSVQNEGLKARTLELRPRGDQAGGRTCLGTISCDDGAGNSPVVYALSRYDSVSKELQPGEEICLVQFVWNQIRGDNGEAASPGYYDLAIVLDNLYVDGKKPANWPTFEVRSERRVNFQKSVPWVDPRELLRAEGLVVSLGLEKVIYQKGEQIPIWFEVKNEGTQTRTLEARPMILGSLPAGDGFGRSKGGADMRGGELETCSGGFMYYTPDGHDYVGAGGFVRYDTVRMDVPPGETIRFIEYVWDQVNWDGSPAQAGYYDAYIRVCNLYVDGRQLRETLSFEVDVSAPIRIDE